MSSKYWYLYQFCYVKVFSTNQNENLLLLDDPGRVRSQIASIVRQIQRFDFDRNLVLVVTRKVFLKNMNRVTFTFKTSIVCVQDTRGHPDEGCTKFSTPDPRSPAML